MHAVILAIAVITADITAGSDRNVHQGIIMSKLAVTGMFFVLVSI
ncbi:MAG: hypothetical protein ACLFSO_08135 [Halanaerobium sp.]